MKEKTKKFINDHYEAVVAGTVLVCAVGVYLAVRGIDKSGRYPWGSGKELNALIFVPDVNLDALEEQLRLAQS